MQNTDQLEHAGQPGPLPLRMLNEYVYCPRLFHLMHVEGRWADNVYTIEGRNVHRRVDRIDHILPDTDNIPDDSGTTEDDTGAKVKSPKRRNTSDDGDDPPEISRSVPLDSPTLGVTAKLDLVSTAGDEAVPVDTKRGRVPNNPERSYEPERVQLMAQGLLLREQGYRCDHGVLYFAGSHTRVDIPFTGDLEARTRTFIAQARRASQRRDFPLPLDDSPKCRGCSLSAICLPDETLALQHVPPDPAVEVRRLYPARDDALPLYIQEQGANVGKRGEQLVISKSRDELARVPLKDVSQLVLCGNIGITAQTIHLLCQAAIPIVHLSMGHWFYGITHGSGIRNAYDRAAQFAAAAEPARCLTLARDLVIAKGVNQRTMIRRNGSPPPETLRDMNDLIQRIPAVETIKQLLGFEEQLAALYFRHFNTMLRPRDFDAEWEFNNRNRRPPRDPVNALLSFGYAMLSKEFTVVLQAEGLDPWWGFYHQPRHGRPALALDLMEPFRPVIVDSAVITAVNTGMVRNADFTRSAAGCVMNATGRKAFIRAYEARLDQMVTHPVFDYRCAWRAMISLHARLLSRWLRGDIPNYQSITTR